MSKEIKVSDRRKFATLGEPKRANKVLSSPKAPSVKAIPLGSKAILWRVPEAEGLIELAEVAREKPLACIVLAVSSVGLNEYDTKALQQLQPGDKVLIRKNSGTEVKIDDHEVTIIHVQDILAKI